MNEQPDIGEWYRVRGGGLFEVVAVDEDDRTVEVQHFDGTVEELDLDDWRSQHADGSLVSAEAPEDWSGSVDAEDSEPDPDQGSDQRSTSQNIIEGGPGVKAGEYDGLDLFE